LIQSGLTGPVTCLRPQSLSLANSPWDTPVGTPAEAPTGFMSLTRPRNDRKKPRPTSLPVTLGEALERALPPKKEEKEEKETEEKEAESSDWDSEEEFEEEEKEVEDGATLGREGTMQGREEIWQANGTVEKSSDEEEEEEDEDEDESNNEELEAKIDVGEQREEKSDESEAEVEKEVLKKREGGRAILPEFPTPIKVPNVQFTAREISLDDPPAAPPRKKKHRKPLDDSDAEDGFTKAAYAPLKRRLRAVVTDR